MHPDVFCCGLNGKGHSKSCSKFFQCIFSYFHAYVRLVIYCCLEREVYKVLKFRENNSFEIRLSLF